MRKTSKSLNQLKHLMKYVHLLTETTAQVFEVDLKEDFKTAKDVLEKAINVLKNIHAKHDEFRV
jgi:hypothetical protein